jgi:hypothetical protein
VGKRGGKCRRYTKEHNDTSSNPASSQGGGSKNSHRECEVYQPRGVVGVGSRAGEQIRDQGNGSMADETTVHVFGEN